MKKLFTVLVAFCMTLSVTGCGADKKDEKDKIIESCNKLAISHKFSHKFKEDA